MSDSHLFLTPLPKTSPLAGLPRILPGPMEGVTEGPFVQAMMAMGWVSCWFTPFLRISTGIPRTARLRDWLQPYLVSGLPVIAQIMGTETRLLAEAAGRLRELGAACVDLNCACPSRIVLSNGGGACRLQDPRWITDTLLAMKERCQGGPVSVKLRTGFASPEEFPALAEAVRAAAPDLVTLHFRTAAEHYSPVSGGLERLKQARQLLPDCLLYGSGDLYTPEDILRFEEIGLDGAAPARGILKNPALIPETVHFLKDGEQLSLPVGQKLEFLRKIVEYSPKKCYNGFILQITGNLFGRSSGLFQQLIKYPTIPRVRAFFSSLSGTELENLCL